MVEETLSWKGVLEKYRFPKIGIFTKDNFIEDCKANKKHPSWANKFLKEKEFQISNSEISSRIGGYHINSGIAGKVYEDVINSDFIIKTIKIRDRSGNKIIDSIQDKEIEREVKAFRKCYGTKTASYFRDDIKGMYYIRLLRIPGIPISSLRKGSLPRNADVLFDDMIKLLSSKNIIHSDLSEGNILWDENSNRFLPIDMEIPYNKRHRETLLRRQNERIPGIKKELLNITRYSANK